MIFFHKSTARRPNPAITKRMVRPVVIRHMQQNHDEHGQVAERPLYSIHQKPRHRLSTRRVFAVKRAHFATLRPDEHDRKHTNG